MLDTSDLKVFFQMRIANAGMYANIGDWFLTPIRHFSGRDITIAEDRYQGAEVTSLAPYKYQHRSDTETWEYPWLKTAFLISFLVPGLIIGSIFKGIAYSKGEFREKHDLVKLHLTPVPLAQVGTVENPLLSEKEVINHIAALYRDNMHRKIHTLVIYGNNVNLSQHIPCIKPLGIKKLILVGTQIVHNRIATKRFDDELSLSKKWLATKVRRNPVDINETYITQIKVPSVQEAIAKKPPTRVMLPWPKRYHAVYVVVPHAG